MRLGLTCIGLIASITWWQASAESITLNDRYSVEWKVDGGEITFTVTAKTTGWIGLGFGPSKHMTGADLVIGGVKDGKGYLHVSLGYSPHPPATVYSQTSFQDLHGIDDDTPSLDQQEDYHLLDATESSGQTVLKFKRKLDTGDKDDVALTVSPLPSPWPCRGYPPLSGVRLYPVGVPHRRRGQ